MDRPETAQRVVLCAIGTRPEVVKMAPIVLRLRQIDGLRVRLVSTGQHRGLLDRALADFGLTADIDLHLIRSAQTLAETTARALTALDETFEAERPDFVLSQGDTTTVLASYYRKIPFGHVEAGLRTGQPYRLFPEERNRVLAGYLAEVHLAPTPGAGSTCWPKGSPIPRSTSPATQESMRSGWPSTARPRSRSGPKPTG